MTAYQAVSLAASAGHLALGLLAIIRSARSRLAAPLAWLCLVMFGWNFATLAHRVSGHAEWTYLDASISPLTTPVALHFVLVFVGERRRLRWFLRLAYLAFGALSAVSACAFLCEWARFFSDSKYWSLTHLLLAVPLLCFMIWLVIRHLRQQSSAEEQMRTRLVLAAAAVGALFATTELWAGAGLSVPRLGPLATLVVTALLAVVALRYRLFERNLSSLAAVYALSIASVAVLGYLAVFRLLVASAAVLVFATATLTLLVVAVTWRIVAAAAAWRAQLERLALLGRLSAQMAHDIKNPLAGLKGATQFLQEERARGRSIDDRGEFLNLLVGEIDRLSRLVDKYRRLGTLEPDRADTQLNDLVRSTLELGRFGAAQGVRIRTELAPDLGPCQLDADLATAALENLIHNAVQAMPQGGELVVRTEATGEPDEPDGVMITVTDTGIGMSARTRERAFDEFFTTKDTGGGLGLALVKRVAKAHGGEVTLQSRLGKGTQVRLRLPRR
jgi:two-component system sensor histidine kinase HydH